MDRDPTRIPIILEELRRTWEAQPEMPFAHLLLGLSTHGVSATSTDEEVVQALQAVRGQRLPALPSKLSETDRFVLRFADHPRLLSLRGNTVVSWQRQSSERASRRSAAGSGHADTTPRTPLRPSVWTLSEVRRAEVSMPLVLLDTEGMSHRLGVIERIERLADVERSPEGLHRSERGAGYWCIDVEDDVRLQLGRELVEFRRGRRTSSTRSYRWEQVLECSLGAPLRVRTAGGEIRQFGAVVTWVQIKDQ
ncbi:MULTISPECIES: hypothetical protein [Corynebacterium]|uniref:hypothetical protein n=1 Tax=Corynebacterium TaxID=1716 RepID=UPI00124E1227|nr:MULTISPECIES: hypothetical protein [Corynebacterium]